jgi:hypothetical protein
LNDGVELFPIQMSRNWDRSTRARKIRNKSKRNAAQSRNSSIYSISARWYVPLRNLLITTMGPKYLGFLLCPNDFLFCEETHSQPWHNSDLTLDTARLARRLSKNLYFPLQLGEGEGRHCGRLSCVPCFLLHSYFPPSRVSLKLVLGSSSVHPGPTNRTRSCQK